MNAEQKRKRYYRQKKLKQCIYGACTTKTTKNKILCEKHGKLQNERGRKERHRRLMLVFSWLGKICRCCGIKDLVFLTFDHIKDDGYKEGRHDYLLRKIVKKGMKWTRKNIQILCSNCQWGKRKGDGRCLHHPNVNLRKPQKYPKDI